MRDKQLTKRFVRGSASSMLAILVSMAALMVTGKMVALSFTRDLVGLFALALVSADFLNLLLGLGLPVAMPRLVAAVDEQDRPAVGRHAVRLLGYVAAVSGMAALPVMFLVATFPSGSADSFAGLLSEPHWIILLWLLGISGMARDLLMSVLAGLDQYGVRAMAIEITSLLQVLLVGGAVLLPRDTVAWLVLAMTISYLLAVIWMGGALQGSWRVRGGFHPARSARESMRGMLRFSAPLWVNQLLTFFYQRFDTVLVSALLGLAPAAVFEMVKRLPMMMTRVLGAGLTPYLPHVTRLTAAEDHAGAARLVERAARITACAGYGAALLVIVMREPAVLVLFSSEYLSGSDTLPLLLASAVIALQTGVMGQTLIALGRNTAVTLINTGMVAAGLALNAALIPHFGMKGAGWASVGAIALSGLMQALWVRRSGISARWRALLLPHAAFAVSVLPALHCPLSPWRLSGPALFATLAFALGMVAPGEIRRAAEAFRPDNGPTRES